MAATELTRMTCDEGGHNEPPALQPPKTEQLQGI